MKDSRERLRDSSEAIAAIDRYRDRDRSAFEQDELLLPRLVRAKPSNHRRDGTGLSRQSPQSEAWQSLAVLRSESNATQKEDASDSAERRARLPPR
jgi:hypothetical protein